MSMRAEAAKEVLARRRARENLHDFILYFRPDYIASDFSRGVCAAIDRFLVDMAQGKRPILCLGAPPQHGKQYANSTPVLTANRGWVTHGEIVPGDIVYRPDGTETAVVAVGPKIKSNRKVIFSDGSELITHAQHEWLLHRTWVKGRTVRIFETREIEEKGLWAGKQGSRGCRANFQLPDVSALPGRETTLPVRPYSLGVWLGDGKRSSGTITVSGNDTDIVRGIGNDGYELSAKCKCNRNDIHASYKTLRRALSAAGLLCKNSSEPKRIPDAYFTASTSQRLELLAGLIDSDGYVYPKNGRVTFSNTEPELVLGVVRLISTFGWRVTTTWFKARMSSSGMQGRKDTAQVCFQPDIAIPCRLKRYRDALRLSSMKRKRSIVSIEQGEFEEGNCIQVAHADGMYLVGDTLIPTHNSEIVSRFLPAYAFGRYPDLRVGGLSYAFPLATNMNRDVQRIMLDPRYGNVFPETTLNSRRVVTVEVEAKRNSEEFEIVGRRGSYVSQGVGGPLTGRPLDLGIIDDPIKNAQEANSETIKSGIWDWYISTFLTRLSKNSGQIIMATRWSTDDLTGRVLEKYERALSLKYEAINEDGQALVPELHPVEKLLETRQTLGEYYWAALYQQSPVPAGGGMFKPGMIEIVEALPAGLRFTRGWDLAASKDAGDWTVGGSLAIKDGVTYIGDIVRERGGPDEIESLIVNTSKADGRTTFQSLPQDPGQAGKAQAAYLGKKLQGIRFEFTPETGDKATRASPFAAQVNAGNVKMLRAEWNDALIHEMRTFPMGKNDDQIDALSRAYNKAWSRRVPIRDML